MANEIENFNESDLLKKYVRLRIAQNSIKFPIP